MNDIWGRAFSFGIIPNYYILLIILISSMLNIVKNK